MKISKKICPIFKIQNGEFLEANREGDNLVIKTKIDNKNTYKTIISKSELNIEDIIKNQGGDEFKEIQYISLIKTQLGDLDKIISFTLNKDTIKQIKTGEIKSNQIIENSIDTWISQNL